MPQKKKPVPRPSKRQRGAKVAVRRRVIDTVTYIGNFEGELIAFRIPRQT